MSETAQQPSVLFVLPWELHYPGGVNQVVKNLYDQAAIQGVCTPRILIYDWRAHDLREAPVEGRNIARFRILSALPKSGKAMGLIRYLLLLPKTIVELRRYLLVHSVMTVNVHYLTAEAAIFTLMRRLKLWRGRLVVSVHGQDVRNLAAIKAGVERGVLINILRNADSIVACSASLAKEVSQLVPSIEAKVETIHNGVAYRSVAPDYSDNIDERLQGHLYILNVATFEEKKGQDVLLQAFAQVHKNQPQLRLVLIGRSGLFLESIVALVNELGIADSVVIIRDLAHQSVARYMLAATIFVLPSRYEPFGIVILEAGLQKIPTVASRVGGIPEIITHEVTGYLVEPDDANALAEQLTSLLNDAETRTKLGENLYSHVMRNFTWESVYRLYEKVLCTGATTAPRVQGSL